MLNDAPSGLCGPPTESYSLLDSGGGEKLERFGDRLIVRPSSLSCWKRRRPGAWEGAHARFDPDSGWAFSGKRFEEWRVELGTFAMILRLQSNGQIGFFPEHYSYLHMLDRPAEGQPCSALNLFAFTGLATLYLVKAGWSVCHVDISKRALDWAAQNLSSNGIEPASSGVRLICEDAVKFAEREARRGNGYDLVIADPPSFSRVTKQSSWQLEQVVDRLIADCLRVLRPGGALLLTSHHPALNSEVLANLIYDNAAGARIETRGLQIGEEGSPRKLPSGHLALAVLDS